MIWPLETSTINRFSGQLPDIHDEIIVATALELQGSHGPTSIITRDAVIHSLGLVSCIW